MRDGSAQEGSARSRTYYRHLAALVQDDFVEACDRILYTDEWFPTIARLRTVAAECRTERARSRQAHATALPAATLVCPYCHGSRWVRLGGYDPMNMHAGMDGSRSQPCPRCTMDGRYDPILERRIIADEGGVPNPMADKQIDMSRQTWPAQLAAMRDPATGHVDMDALYRHSRVLRGLDPNVDARPVAIPGFATIARIAATPPPAPPEPARELAMVGAGQEDDDDIPFD